MTARSRRMCVVAAVALFGAACVWFGLGEYAAACGHFLAAALFLIGALR